jgi:hypothetical protein
MVEEVEVLALMDAAGFGAVRRVEGRGRRPDRFVCLTGVRGGAEAAR